MTTVSEIALDVFRVSTFVPDINRVGVVSYQSEADNVAHSSVSNRSTDSITIIGGLTMKFRNALLLVTLVMIPGSVWAYGDSSGGGNEGCKVKFSKHMPAHGAEVAAKSDFSFFASGETNPNSIKVTIKGQSVPVTVTPKNQGFQVAGILPDTLKGAFAKINIAAKGPGQCEASDGWLVKVTE